MCVCVQGVEFELEDLDLWEPVLVGVTTRKQMMDEVLKRKENRFLGKVSPKQKVCNRKCVCPILDTTGTHTHSHGALCPGLTPPGGGAVSRFQVELGPRAFQMPQPWSRCISVSKKGRVAALLWPPGSWAPRSDGLFGSSPRQL